MEQHRLVRIGLLTLLWSLSLSAADAGKPAAAEPAVAAIAGESGAATASEPTPTPVAAGSAAPAEEPEEEAAAGAEDVDPRQIVFFNLRFQHSELGDGARIDNVLFRRDAAIPRPRSWLPGERLGTVRADIPVGNLHAGGEDTFGLGDLYLQALNVRRWNRRFSLASGLGFQLPTATDDLLGLGKWQVAPSIFPIWTLPAWRGLFLVRAQDFVSVAGDDDRADIHYLKIAPTLFRPIGKGKFMLIDTEVVADWERDSEASFRTNLVLGTTLHGRRAVWVKLGVPWGEHRRGDWLLEASVAKRKRPRPPGAASSGQ